MKELKIVTFEIAKVIKDAGYPQDNNCDTIIYDIEGVPNKYYTPGVHYYCVAPTYLEVWLWLWREKKISIPVNEHEDDFDGEIIGFSSWVIIGNRDGFFEESDPEEVIIAAINHLVNKNLLK